MILELHESYEYCLREWEYRREVGIKNVESCKPMARLFNDYYEDIKPTEGRVVWSMEYNGGVEGFRGFLDAYTAACRRYLNSKLVIR